MGSRSNIDLAYIAGFLDGDGSLMLQIKKRADGKNKIRFMATICLYQDARHQKDLLWVQKVFIIGEGEEREKLKKIIDNLNLENKVFLVGFLQDANQYLKAFDIFTLTSVKEGLPYTILEAGLAGLPVIASSVGGIPDIIESGVNGTLTEKADVEGITKAIQSMIDNPNERKMFGAKLQEKVEKEFSQKQMLSKTIEVYSCETR